MGFDRVSFGYRRNDLVQRQIRLLDRVSRKSACSSNGEVLPPLGFAATLPVCSKRCAQSTTTLALSSYRSATSRRDAPASIASITRARKSLEYGLGIDRPLRIESMPLDSLVDKPLGILPIQSERNTL
jgi:hypothetical protein